MGELEGYMTRRARGPRALGEAVATVAAPVTGRQGFAGGAILSEWPTIVGDHLAAQSVPEKVIHPRGKKGGGTLRLCVASGGVATEFQHLEPLLLDRINTYLGYSAIARLQYVHRPLPRKAPPPPPSPRPLTPEEEQYLENAVAGIEDARLRQSVEKLARAILGRQIDTNSDDPFGGN